MVAAERHHRPLVIIVIIDKCRHRYNSRPRSAVSSSSSSSGAARWSEEARRLQFTAFLCSSESAGVRFLGFIGQTLKLFHRLRKKQTKKKTFFIFSHFFLLLLFFFLFECGLRLMNEAKIHFPFKCPVPSRKNNNNKKKAEGKTWQRSGVFIRFRAE